MEPHLLLENNKLGYSLIRYPRLQQSLDDSIYNLDGALAPTGDYNLYRPELQLVWSLASR